LAVAGLFNPLRHRVQQLVDRRFNRSRYDAEVLIDSFSTRLRSGINLSDVLDDLRSVLARTVEPDSTMIWVRRSLG
jgi:Flp pilus assembly protein TadB